MSKQIKISGKDFLIDFSDEQKSKGTLNGNGFSWDVSTISENVYHVIKDNQSYNVEVLEAEPGTHRIKVNGNVYEAETIDKFDELLKKLGMEKGGVGKVNELKAPMPGLVLEVSVEVGATVAKGDRLLVLEAMKMENVIKSPTDATIASIEINKSETVEKNQVMIRFS
ncbi:MAG: biotin/lipoyl-containing protein [Flavobacteriales bacterium]